MIGLGISKLLGISFVGGGQVFTFIEGQLAFSWCVLHCCIGRSVWRSRAWGDVLKELTLAHSVV